jgi:hypothetical protein
MAGRVIALRAAARRPLRTWPMSAAPAIIIRPSIAVWQAAARAEQAKIEAEIARCAAIQAYLERRLERRKRAKVEQLAFDFGNMT